MRIEPVEGRRALREFQRVPFDLYDGDPNWVAPLLFMERQFLDPARNPFFRHAEARLFLARDERGRAVGRIGACVDRNFQAAFGEPAGTFGFFEAASGEAAGALLAAAEAYLSGRGCRSVLGPMSFTTNHASCGLLVDGLAGPPALMMSYNPPGYARWIEAAGYEKAKDLLAYFRTSETQFPEKVARVMTRILEKGEIAIRSVPSGEFERTLDSVRDLYARAWEKNWGFVPMTPEEFSEMAKELKSICDPDLLLLATVGGKPAGFSLALPDINPLLQRCHGRLFPFGIFHLLFRRKSLCRLRILLLGVAPEYRMKGIESGFYLETFRIGTKKGYTEGEMSWILEDNILMNQALERLGARPYRRYRIFRKALGAVEPVGREGGVG